MVLVGERIGVVAKGQARESEWIFGWLERIKFLASTQRLGTRLETKEDLIILSLAIVLRT